MTAGLFQNKSSKIICDFFFFYQIILCFYLLFRFTLFPHCSVKKRKVSIRFGQDSVCYCMNIVKQDCGYKSDPLLYSISQWGRLHLCKEVHWADRGTRYSSASERQVRSFLFLYFNKVNVSTGITTVGLYRTGGVNSKVQRLMTSVFGLLLLFWSDSCSFRGPSLLFQPCASLQRPQLLLRYSWIQMSGTTRP